MVLVASPNAIGRMPVASGSSVPAWPTLAALKMRRTLPTAAADERPSGLSRTSQPLTLSPLRFLAIRIQVAPHRRLAQRLVDALGVFERRIRLEAELGCAAQLHELD